jgi:hypothetical protein
MTADDRHDSDATKAYTPQPPAAGRLFADDDADPRS